MLALHRLTAAVVITALVAGIVVQAPTGARATTEKAAAPVPAPETVDAKISGFDEAPYSASSAEVNAASDALTASAPVEAPIPFSLLGFDVPVGDELEFRTSLDGESWSDWQVAEALDEGPDGQPATTGGMIATSATWTGPSRWLQIAADEPARVVAHLIDSLGQSDETSSATTSTPSTTGDAATQSSADVDADFFAAGVSRPTIISRAGWGANESITGNVGIARSAQFAVVHHTAGTNSYTKAEAPGVVRGIQHYHAVTRGWSDIGYNFLIDKYGQIYEGRKGGVMNAVIGAHAAGFNTGSIGVSLMANLDTAAPTSAAMASLRRLLAWKLSLHGIDPTDTIDVVSGGSPKYSSGTRLRLPAINGHRDTGLTSCPGKTLYPLLPDLRTQVKSDMASAPSAPDYVRQCEPEGNPDDGDVWRIKGADRVATAIAASVWYWRSSDVAVLASADDFPDALAAGALAAQQDAPLLLTDTERLSPSVADRLTAMGVKRVFLMGGPATLSERITQDLSRMQISATRVAGTDRYGTAAKAAGLAGAPTREVTLALGAHEDQTRAWPDAVAAGALVATPARMPTLLTRTASLPAPTAAALRDLGVSTVWILGDVGAVSGQVEQAVESMGITVRRLAGKTRYGTSAAAAAEATKRLGGSGTDVVIASGANFPDALAGAALAARRDASLLLVPPCALEQAPETSAYLGKAASQYRYGLMLGDTGAISERVRWQLGKFLPTA